MIWVACNSHYGRLLGGGGVLAMSGYNKAQITCQINDEESLIVIFSWVKFDLYCISSRIV